MMNDAVRALETGALAEVGLLAFVVAFLVVVAYAGTLSKPRREAAKRLPLDGAEEAFPAATRNGARP